MKTKAFYDRVDLNGGVDREIGAWKIIDIHQIPNVWSDHHEVDFYCCNGKDVYLLRLRNRVVKKLYVVTDETGMGYPPYLISELPINHVDDSLIKTLLDEFSLMI